MPNKVEKIIRHLNSIQQTFANDMLFSKKLAVTRLSMTFDHYLRRNTAEKNKKIHKLIRAYLTDTVAPVLESMTEENGYSDDYDCKSSPIWICWWQGEEQAPELVRQCICSIRAHAGTHPVIIVTGDNFREYLDIPDYILEKVEDRRMCIANFSDYLRFSLLEKYGGLWLDATIFVPFSLPEEMFNRPFFTCNAHPGNGYISNGRWTSFCMGGWAHNTIFSYMKASFEVYWKNNNSSIDYLLVDYLLDVGYDHISAMRKMVDALPLNNQHRNYPAAAMINGLPAEAFVSVISGDTFVYKLSWREHYPKKTDAGTDTVYSAFLQMKW